MDPSVVGLIAIVALVLMLFAGFHVFVAMGLVGLVGFWAVTDNLSGTGALASATAYSVGATYEFSVIPLFILLGMIIYESGMATTIYEAMYRWFGRLPGGLAIATTFAVAFFSAVSGSSLACAVTFSKLAIPEMVKRGYHKGLACGLVAGASTQDSLIPPSALLVIYAILTEQSIGKCLMAGMLPGILSCLLYVAAEIGVAKIKPAWMPKGPSFTMKEKIESVRGAWQIPLLAILILGAIYSGICTPTEAAAVGTFMAMVIGLWAVGLRKLKLPQSLKNTVTSSAFLYAILIGAFIFSSFMAVSQIPAQMSDIIKASGVSRGMVLLIIIVIYTILGCFMSATAMVVVTMPIFFPIMMSLKYDPIWFGVIVVKMAGIGMLTPPVGLSVYAVKATVGDMAKLEEVFKGSMIFLVMDYIALAFIIYFPSLSLYLPNMMMK
ncbi:MAG TPA: TRAP transporter large permease [Thermodesulfobacteriota bacterium]|nr:TRAP transporter large permease [Thermodesulfobacteriota bacterium]